MSKELQQFYGAMEIDGKEVKGELWKLADGLVLTISIDNESSIEIYGKDIQAIKDMVSKTNLFIKQCEL